jgi:hypothetical protein
MDKTERLALIARYESAVDPLIDFIKTIPAAVIDYRPDLPAAWTVREHAVHFLDADAFAHARIRFAVAEPGTEVNVWNQQAFQERARYETADPLTSLETARTLRRVACAMARALVDADWEAYYVRHPERGRLTLANIFTTYIDHAEFHINYFRRNLGAFKAEGN